MSSDKRMRAALANIFMMLMIFCIPSYFAIKNAIESEKNAAVAGILEWISYNENLIFTSGGIRPPPKSDFEITIYDSQKNILYTNANTTVQIFSFGDYFEYPYVYYQKKIVKADLLYHLVVSTKIHYGSIAIIGAILLIAVPLIIILMSNYFLNASVYPQKQIGELFNDMMHELKTPLGIISINLELIDPKGRNSRHLLRLKSAAKQMQTMYDELEYFARHKIIFFPKEVINFSEFLRLRIDFFDDMAGAKNIKFTSKIDDEIFININKTQLQRLIDNNLSNAVKYSFFNSHIKISLKKINDAQALFEVEDSGEGISSTKSVFKRFSRENTTQSGFGIGLDIVRNICRENGIVINLRSSKNQGSVFGYTFKTCTP